MHRKSSLLSSAVNWNHATVLTLFGMFINKTYQQEDKDVQEDTEEFRQILRFQVAGILSYELMRARRNFSSFWQ